MVIGDYQISMVCLCFEHDIITVYIKYVDLREIKFASHCCIIISTIILALGHYHDVHFKLLSGDICSCSGSINQKPASWPISVYFSRYPGTPMKINCGSDWSGTMATINREGKTVQPFRMLHDSLSGTGFTMTQSAHESGPRFAPFGVSPGTVAQMEKHCFNMSICTSY